MFRSITIQEEHVTDHELVQPSRSLLGDRFSESSTQVSKCGGEWIVLKKSPLKKLRLLVRLTKKEPQ